MTDEFNYKKEWAYQKKQADQWFEVYQRALDTMQELVNKLQEYEKRKKKND